MFTIFVYLGVIPKAVMDSMDFLRTFHLVKDSKKGHAKRHSFKGKTYKPLEISWYQLKAPVCSLISLPQILTVMQSVKTVPWIQGRSKVRPPAVCEQKQESTSGDRPKLRRSLGLESFPNVELFRTCMPGAGKRNVKEETCCNGCEFSILYRI